MSVTNSEMNDSVNNASQIKYSLEQVVAYIRDIPAYHQHLNDQRSMIDKTLCDIDHECELSRLNACEMVELWKLQRQALIRRRQIKNEQEILQKFEEVFDGDLSTVGKCQEVLRHMNEAKARQKDRKYKPRVLQGLKLNNV